MANTQVANGSSLNPIIVQEKLISVMAERDNLFAPLIGTGMDSVVQKITDLQKNSGDTVKFHLGAKLTGSGVTGDSTLEGSEEAMVHYADSLLIDQIRNAVRLDGVMTEQRSAINLRKEAGPRLGIWAREWLTELITVYASGARGVRTGLILPTSFTGFAGNSLQAPDSGHLLIAGAGTKLGLTSSDVMTTTILDKAVRKIKLLINTGAAMRPVSVKGKKYFIALLTPEQIYDLRQDSKWQSAQQQANIRGEENPLFSGAEGVWNGLVIYENAAGVLFNDYGAGANVGAARAVILGAQSLGIAYGKSGAASDGNFKYIEKTDFDYYNQTGFAVSSVVGVKKLQFNSKDYGTFTVDTAYTP